LTATIASGLTTLTDKMHVRIEAADANATTAPTFTLTLGSTATGTKTIKKGNAQPLLAGDIAGAGHMLELVWDSGGDCWLLQNPAFQIGQSTSALAADSVQNVGIAFSTGSGALTASLKTASGGTPSSSDQVSAAMRSSSASTGTYTTRTATEATSLTVSSGSTLGHESGIEGDLHWYLLDNSGTLELAVSNKFFGYSGIVSTTAEGGSGGADSSTVMYSTSARSNVPFAWICKTRDTQTVAGTWAATPTSVDLVRAPHAPFEQQGDHIIRDDNDTFGVRSQPLYDGFRNRLMNGQFSVAQRGTAFTSASSPANSDDTYLLDRWNLLSDGNDIVDVSQETSTVPTGRQSAIKLDVETANKKFGIVQFIEQKNCVGLLGGKATLSFKARKGASNATLETMRAAIITWSSTADTVTSDVVSAWEASGTNPTLAANWTYENTPADLTLTDSYQTFRIEDIDVDTASGANVAVLLYYNDADGTVGDLLYVTDVQLEPGRVATEFEYRPHGTELELCKRYYTKNAGAKVRVGQARETANSRTSYGLVSLTAEMRAVPSVSLADIDYTGAASLATGLVGQSHFSVAWTASATLTQVDFNYTADAEL
jgi:hypothetical protein